MHRAVRSLSLSSLLLPLVALPSCGAAGTSSPDEVRASTGYQNLQVLPPDTGRDELGELMLDFLSGLGLPRRAGRGCLHCHEGSLEVPRSQWDYASDALPAKQQAREMLRMVREINAQHLPAARRAGIAGEALEVSCHTCHRGRLDPAPMLDVLRSRYRDDGLDALQATYRDLHSRYFGADAYDFRVHVLAGLARELAEAGSYDDAAAVHGLNAEYHEDPEATAGLVALRMEQALEQSDVAAMVARYRELKAEHDPAVFGPMLLDRLGWRIFRAGRRDAGFALFALNHAEHPDSFTATEDLAYGCLEMGQPERAVQLAEGWVAAHPGHEAGRLMRDEIVRRAGG